MDINDKVEALEKILECMKQWDNLVWDHVKKVDIIIGLSGIAKEICLLPTKRTGSAKRLWVKDWRTKRMELGSFSFLAKELFLTDEASYKNYLRVTKTQFKFLLTLVENDLTRCNTEMRDAIPPSEQLAVTLRFLATGETFQSLNYQTRLSTSTISNALPKVCAILKGSYLKFPSSILEWEAIAKEFAIKWQFPNCIGALDGKHINFRSFRKDGAFYHNYKGSNSIVLMALVDANCKFIFVDVGCNGRNNDAGVFHQSKLSTFLKEGKDIPQNAVVGHGRSLPHVVLSRARHVVEHAFGMLANRFRVFLAPINLRAEKVQTIVLTCCALHNLLLDRDYVNSYQNNAPISSAGTSGSTFNPQRGQAETIRQQFTEYFSNEGKLEWLE